MVIVGAGFAGLAAAVTLAEAGVDFVVLEARDRVGGRVESMQNGLGERIDTGGQYFCDDMPEIAALARRHGKTWVDGLHDGEVLVQPEAMAAGADDLYERFVAIRDRANELDPLDPAIAGLSVRAWTERQPDAADAKQAFLCSIEGLWCQPTDVVPMWYLVSNDRRITNEVPELQYFLEETMHSLAEDLGRSIGSRLRLGEAARHVRYGHDGATVRTDAGVYEARHVILALPPVTARQVSFDPPVPAGLNKALAAWGSGTVIKGLVRYERPFWRERGLNSIFFLDPAGLYICDASHDDGRPALVVFAGGSLATTWRARGEGAVRTAVLDRLVGALGPDAGEPLDMTLRDWSQDQWSGGGYSDTILDFSATDAEETLLRGLPGLAFACSELSPSFPGYIEGAIIAGRRAAKDWMASQSAIATSASGS